MNSRNKLDHSASSPQKWDGWALWKEENSYELKKRTRIHRAPSPKGTRHGFWFKNGGKLIRPVVGLPGVLKT